MGTTQIRQEGLATNETARLIGPEPRTVATESDNMCCHEMIRFVLPSVFRVLDFGHKLGITRRAPLPEIDFDVASRPGV